MISEGGAARAYHMLGNYEINATVGKGGMGIVYRAHDHILNRTVALKVLREDLRVQESLVSRFQREARAVAALDHPNIVHVYSVGAIDEIPYIAMEFIDGRPLNEVVKRNKRLDWEVTLKAAAQVARGLAAAHEKGIIHRDIKPGNILVTRDGHAFITDFGIAKVLSADTQLTVDGSRLGTPHYMAPERCEGQPADAYGDIYSLGIVMYQCISGELPFDAQTPASLIEQIASSPVPRLADKVANVPSDVDRLVAWITEKDARHRPSSARALADAIDRVAAGMPLEEEGPNLADALAEFRDTESTPAPRDSKSPGVKKQSYLARRISRGAKRWNRLPVAVQAFVVGGAALIVGATAAPLISTPRLHDPLIPIAQTPDSGSLRWQASSMPGVFQEEGAGVWSAQLGLEDFAIRRLTSSGDRALVSLQGKNATPWHNRVAAMTIDPRTPAMSIEIEPVLPSASETLEVAVSSVVSTNGSLVRIRVPNVDGSIGTSEILWNSADHDMEYGGIVALSGSGRMVLVASTIGNPERQFIVEPEVDAGGSVVNVQPLTSRGSSIVEVVLSPDGGIIAYTRENAEGIRAIHIADGRGGARESLPLIEGAVQLANQPFTRGGEAIAVIQTSDSPELVIVNRADGIVLGKAIPAGDGTIHATTNTLAYVSTDRHGQDQVWTSTLDRTSMSVQRTFIEGGVAAEGIVIAGDFACAIAATAEAPTLVCVDLLSPQ